MATKAMKKGSKAMKAMKAMKGAAKAMKAMKAAMKVSAKLTKRHVYAGKTTKTRGRLAKSDLMKNKRGKVVSKALSAVAKAKPMDRGLQRSQDDSRHSGLGPCQEGLALLQQGQLDIHCVQGLQAGAARLQPRSASTMLNC